MRLSAATQQKLLDTDFVVAIPGHRHQELLFVAGRASRQVVILLTSAKQLIAILDYSKKPETNMLQLSSKSCTQKSSLQQEVIAAPQLRRLVVFRACRLT